jgi:hypothetical protein
MWRHDEGNKKSLLTATKGCSGLRRIQYGEAGREDLAIVNGEILSRQALRNQKRPRRKMSRYHDDSCVADDDERNRRMGENLRKIAARHNPSRGNR